MNTAQQFYLHVTHPLPSHTPVTDRPQRLGRGLAALLGSADGSANSTAGDSPREVPIDLIRSNPFQPRREFAPAELEGLEASMRSSGLLQPVTLRVAEDGYELIAGERRLRAAKSLGWTTIPAIVRRLDQREMLTLALVENLQRSDLNPIEEADGYHRLQEEFALTQQQIATTVGKDRSTVANLLRLRSLPASVLEMVRVGRLTVGHARALLALPNGADIVATAERVARENLTVRDVERLSRPTPSPRPTVESVLASVAPPLPSSEPEIRRIVDHLRRFLQTDVSVHANARGEGEIRVRFYSGDDLERLLQRMLGANWQQL